MSIVYYDNKIVEQIDNVKKSSFKLCTNCIWVKLIQICSNDGLRRLSSGDTCNNHRRHLVLFLSRTTGVISTKHGTNHPRVKEISVYLK